MFSDFLFILQWWFVFFLIGIIFLPITTSIFSNFFDKGYIFSKVIAMACISYVVFLLGIVKILPFTLPTIIFVVGIFLVINFLIYSSRAARSLKSSSQFTSFSRTIKIFLFEEFLFFLILTFW